MATMWHWLLQLLIFQKLGKSGFCTCHLQESITQWCMAMVMQTWYQLKAEELLLASTYDLRYEYVYLRNSWPLNFDYLFLGTPCITFIIIKWTLVKFQSTLFSNKLNLIVEGESVSATMFSCPCLWRRCYYRLHCTWCNKNSHIPVSL